jgi:hypothetical protein
MSGRRWKLWLGPPVALLAIAVVFSRFQAGAEAGGRTTPRPAGVCASAAPPKGALQLARGTWWRLEDRLDGNGALVGRTLFAGMAAATRVTLELGSESMASGPVGGLVVVATDDGRFSEVRLVSAAEGCSWLVHRGEDVVRSAILDPSNGSVFAHLVTRETRSDLGTWRMSGMAPDAKRERIVAPLAQQPDLGPVWATELRLDAGAANLAVQSCSDQGCLIRVASLGAVGVPVVVRGPEQGAIVGFAGTRLVTWTRCAGLPCSVLAWNPATNGHELLIDTVAAAALTANGRYLVAVTDPASGRAFRVDVGGAGGARVAQRVEGVAAGDLPLAAGIGAYAGLEVGPDEVAIAAPGAGARPFNAASAPVAP